MAAPNVKIETGEETVEESEEEVKERNHFARIINAFKYYKPFSMKRVTDAEKDFLSLPESHRNMVPNFLQHLETVRKCIEQNDCIIRMIIQDAEHIFENKQNMAKNGSNIMALLPLVSDMDKMKTTLKQFVRDWSAAGEHERKVCYEPVLQEIEHRFPKDSVDSSSVNILVPGAGLGRLTFELAKRGYNCQGNEWSLFMLFSSNFVLNKCKSVNSYTLHPWVHQWTNNMRKEDQVEAVTFPDTDTSAIPENVHFSMAAGDFLEVYQDPGYLLFKVPILLDYTKYMESCPTRLVYLHPDSWDCLATVFFIDTAHNIIAYIETIYKILKPGGYWVNLGPLLYHYSDMPNELSIELSYEEVRSVIEKTGFIFEKEEKNIKSTYTQNPRSMLQYSYDSVFFVVRKPS